MGCLGDRRSGARLASRAAPDTGVGFGEQLGCVADSPKSLVRLGALLRCLGMDTPSRQCHGFARPSDLQRLLTLSPKQCRLNYRRPRRLMKVTVTSISW